MSAPLDREDPSRAAFLLIRARNDSGQRRYLLQKRADGSNHGGTWGLPGGSCHLGERPWDAAVRESREEMGALPPLKPSATFTRADGDRTIYTHLVELPRIFAPSVDGATPTETAGWGWFKRKHVKYLPLHPAFRETWEGVDWKNRAVSANKSAETPMLETTPHLLGPHGLWHTPDRHVGHRQKLPNYIEQVAAALMRDQGLDESTAIAYAINAVKRWARGDLHWGHRKVTPEVVAASRRALAEWEELRASHSG